MSDPDPVCFVVVLLPSAQSTGQLFLLKEPQRVGGPRPDAGRDGVTSGQGEPVLQSLCTPVNYLERIEVRQCAAVPESHFTVEVPRSRAFAMAT